MCHCKPRLSYFSLESFFVVVVFFEEEVDLEVVDLLAGVFFVVVFVDVVLFFVPELAFAVVASVSVEAFFAAAVFLGAAFGFSSAFVVFFAGALRLIEPIVTCV
jgi:hypothetical protein